MIPFQSFTLDNGLRVIVHEDHTVQIAVMNLLYDVGSRDEDPNKTGFAHLFEHLMFGGSANIPSYDEPLQNVGGENNAFTNTDITNYYLTVPASNLETGFWLESDRMLSLSFDPNVLEVQRKVVIEEFKQRYFNQPYGDVWLKLRPLAYQVHPYQWATIGKEISHIENATLTDVKDFFFKHYTPSNAILVVAGNTTTAQVKELATKWFGSIPAGNKYERNIPQEPAQTAPRFLEVKANVPLDALYKAWHIYPRTDPRYYTADLITDILSGGGSSRSRRGSPRRARGADEELHRAEREASAHARPELDAASPVGGGVGPGLPRGGAAPVWPARHAVRPTRAAPGTRRWPGSRRPGSVQSPRRSAAPRPHKGCGKPAAVPGSPRPPGWRRCAWSRSDRKTASSGCDDGAFPGWQAGWRRSRSHRDCWKIR